MTPIMKQFMEERGLTETYEIQGEVYQEFVKYKQARCSHDWKKPGKFGRTCKLCSLFDRTVSAIPTPRGAPTSSILGRLEAAERRIQSLELALKELEKKVVGM